MVKLWNKIKCRLGYHDVINSPTVDDPDFGGMIPQKCKHCGKTRLTPVRWFLDGRGL